MGDRTTTVRGAAMVREVLADEQREMQVRAYKRVRPYLAGALRRLRRDHPAFKTVVFHAERAGFAFIFDDGTRSHEAPRAFVGLKAVCEDLVRFSEIEWITAGDPLWQVLRGTPQTETVHDQYRYVEDSEWGTFQVHAPLHLARFRMRRGIFFRTVYGAHRAGRAWRLVGGDGVVVDEWTDPVEPLIVRAIRENGSKISVEPLCTAMAKIAGFHGRDAFYIWDVLRACQHLQRRGYLRRINPRASDGDARFALAKAAGA